MHKRSESSPFTAQKTRRAFSLVEVVIAVGIFALAIAAIVGILAAIGKGVSDVQDSEKAARLVTVVQSRLQAVPFANIGGALRTSAQVETYDNSTNNDPAYNPASDNTFVFFASEDGSIVAPYPSSGNEGNVTNDPWTLGKSGTSKQERDALKFFELVLIRNDTLSPNNDGGFLAFTIRVRWPAYLGNGARVTDNSQKNVLLVPAAVTR
jgi:uncharacterized protein (TIGR02598 family)